MKKKGIYILTNTINGKEYVGLDSNLPKRANAHLRGTSAVCPLIHRAIKKYGVDAFTFEIIRYPNVPHQILCWFERSHIAERNSKSPNGYNLTDGGDGTLGWIPSAETRAKMSKANQGKMLSAETKAKIAKANRGKTRSAETRAKIAKAKCGENNPMRQPEVAAKFKGENNPNFGKPLSAEHKAKISKAKRGEKHHNFGKTLSAETRAKISETLRRNALEKRGQGTIFTETQQS